MAIKTQIWGKIKYNEHIQMSSEIVWKLVGFHLANALRNMLSSTN
jgi:hypothetical protein